jgi:hypothetical protein
MSLIPSESYSFPDHFLRSVNRARIEPPAKISPQSVSFRARASLAPITMEPTPRPSVVPIKVDLRPAPLAPAVKIEPRRPKAATPAPLIPRNGSPNLPANGAARSHLVRPYAPVKMEQPRPAVFAQSKAAPVVSRARAAAIVDETPEAVQIDMALLKPERNFTAKRSRKWVGFLVAEFFALALFVPTVWFIMARHAADPTILLLANILAITAAAAIALIPIVIFAFAPTLARR